MTIKETYTKLINNQSLDCSTFEFSNVKNYQKRTIIIHSGVSYELRHGQKIKLDYFSIKFKPVQFDRKDKSAPKRIVYIIEYSYNEGEEYKY